MKKLVLYVGISLLLCASCSGRSMRERASGNPKPLQTLSGTLKYYKNQKAVVDLESKEIDSIEGQGFSKSTSYHLDLGKSEEEVAQSPSVIQERIVIEAVPKQDAVAFIESFDGTETTTTLYNNDESEIDNQHLSKSDLYSDDANDDIDPDGCVEADVMKVACNTCVCSDGKYFCSKRECNTSEKPLPPYLLSSTKRKGVIKYHVAKPEYGSKNMTNLEEDDSSDTKNATIDAVTVSNSTNYASTCIDGRSKRVDCNNCVCALGKWACTKMSCIALTLREKASYNGGEFLNSVGTLKEYMNIDEDCMESETKQIGCNQCVCHRNSWACTDFKCPPTVAPVKIQDVQEACQTDEDVKSKDCNICSCRRGVWVCTQNNCNKFGDRYYNPQRHTASNANSNENEQDI